MVLNPQTDCHGTEVLYSDVRAIKMQSSTKTNRSNLKRKKHLLSCCYARIWRNKYCGIWNWISESKALTFYFTTETWKSTRHNGLYTSQQQLNNYVKLFLHAEDFLVTLKNPIRAHPEIRILWPSFKTFPSLSEVLLTDHLFFFRWCVKWLK